MDLITALWLFPILFMIHNFEEIIMIQPWWRHNQKRPPRSPFTSLAKYPPETVASLIAGIFAIFLAITIISIVSNHVIFGLGLALAFGLQLVGHVVEFLRIRRYLPHIVTAVLTLPYYPWLYVRATQSGFSPLELLFATVGMGMFGLCILGLSHALSGSISRWLGATSRK